MIWERALSDAVSRSAREEPCVVREDVVLGGTCHCLRCRMERGYIEVTRAVNSTGNETKIIGFESIY